ncbi:putative ferric-chelate reductase 1 [Xenentodon cancila]
MKLEELKELEALQVDPVPALHHLIPDCYFLSVMMLPSGAAIHYKMTGPSDGYISFGFSDDRMMGNDDIYICGAGSNGSVWIQRAFSTGRKVPLILSLGNISDVEASVVDGVIRCSFTSMNPISTQTTSGFNRTYYLMFAYGTTSTGGIQIHSGTFISSNKINVSKPELLGRARLPSILRAHGALMLIAWMTTGSVGMMVARYLKGMGAGLKLFGKDTWFVVHVTVMTITMVATIIAFILPFVYTRTWSEGAHPVLGCLVLILTLFQFILVLLRCGPQHPLRFLFNWSHSLNGAAIKGLAVAALLTGLKWVDMTAEQWLMKVMGVFVGWEASFYILLEVQRQWKLARSGI